MAFVARKPFTHRGIKYRPGDPVVNFPDDFFRSEGFIRTGYIIEDPNLVVPAPKRKPKSKPEVEVETPVVVEEAVVEEIVVDEVPEAETEA